MRNPLLAVDSYKLSHFSQDPPGTEHKYAYGCPRSGPSDIPILGLYAAACNLSNVLTEKNIEELEEFSTAHGLPFNKDWWDLLSTYGEHGNLPLAITGVPEGTVISPGTPAFGVVNTDPRFPWLTSYVETQVLRSVWYPSTVAAVSRECKKIIKKGLEETADTLEGLPFKLHDFGARGVSSGESAALGGMGHLLNFQGTDTIEAVLEIRALYGEPMAGFSIPATEHSTVTTWGREGESDMFEAFIRNNGGPGKTFACVSDSYNIWKSLEKWKALEPVLKEVGGTLVVRPDSGDPVYTPVKVIEILMELFGSEVNTKGFRVLPEHIRVIQGDGLDKETLKNLVFQLKQARISVDNIAFGMGGGLLQKVTRDTYGWAMKTSAAAVDGVWRDVYKDPVHGGKTSLKGIQMASGQQRYALAFAANPPPESGFVTYYDNGVLSNRDTWGIIKQRAEV